MSVTPIASGLQNVNKVIFIFSECNVKIIYTLRAYPIRAILLDVLRVRSGFCALSVSKLAAPITPGGIGS
ncbi:hypothetical protein B5Z83_00880 [Salmonella enterica subsp. enterica serovar Typhimurium]|nr:hypothetical protein B5Z83_00880 [Salmonella enterica subsp. enterica serovar Typhimurium]